MAQIQTINKIVFISTNPMSDSQMKSIKTINKIVLISVIPMSDLQIEINSNNQ